MKLRVLLVDDEDLARARLRTLLGDCLDPAAEVVGEAANGAQALAWITQHSADVLLLDVRMPGLDGLQLAERLRQLPQPPAVVFVTAHAEHALTAFDVEAIDYLTKPVRRARLQQALARVAQRLGPAVGAVAAVPATAPGGGEVPAIVVNERGRIVRVPLQDVLYLKAELKYVTLRTAQHSYVLDESLTELEPRLGDRFLRVHRNAIVAKRAVRALERRALGSDAGVEAEGDGNETWAVCISLVDEWLAVSRRQVAAVREALGAEGL